MLKSVGWGFLISYQKKASLKGSIFLRPKAPYRMQYNTHYIGGEFTLIKYVCTLNSLVDFKWPLMSVL